MPTPVLFWTLFPRSTAETLPPMLVAVVPGVETMGGCGQREPTTGPGTLVDDTPTPQILDPGSFARARFTPVSSPPDKVIPQPVFAVMVLSSRLNRNAVPPVIWLRWTSIPPVPLGNLRPFPPIAPTPLPTTFTPSSATGAMSRTSTPSRPFVEKDAPVTATRLVGSDGSVPTTFKVEKICNPSRQLPVNATSVPVDTSRPLLTTAPSRWPVTI